MIRPLGNKILIEVRPIEKQTASGIILTEMEHSKNLQGTIIKTNSKIVKIGDEVIFSQYGPVEFKEDEKDYVIAEESHLLAIIEK